MNKEEKDINNSSSSKSQLPKERTFDVFEVTKYEKKYSFVKNNKEILEPLTTSQHDLDKFEEWKKRKRENTSNEIGICVLVVIVTFSGFICIASNWQASLWSIPYIFIAILLVLLSCFMLYANIKEYLDIPSWEIEHCNYARVADKYKVWTRNITRYLIISIDEKHLQFTDDFNYSSVNIGDEVMLFNVKGKNTVYFCKKD